MQRIILGATALVAVAALAVGVVAISRKTSPPSLSRINSELVDVSTRLTQLEAVQPATVSSAATVKHITACLPELTAYVNGESVNITGTGQAYPSSSQQISSYCARLLEGASGGNGP
jgi:hypothetical protein